MAQLTVLASCFLVALGCGTLYIYSAYAPQLSMRLGLSAADISFVGVLGNLAMSFSGPISGILVDTSGFLWPIVLSCVANTLGYTVIIALYSSQSANLALLSLALVFIGLSSTFAFSATVKCAMVEFPRNRGVATSIAMAGYGLSAFFLTQLSSIWGPTTLDLLNVLRFAPFVLFMVFGPLLAFKQNMQTRASQRQSLEEDVNLQTLQTVQNSTAVLAPDSGSLAEVRGTAFFKHPLFLSYSLVLGLLAGMGQTFIYCCGYIVKALAVQEMVENQQDLQSKQVAYISLCNFLGRLVSGACSDLLKAKCGKSRTYTLMLPALICLATQMGALYSSNLAHVTWLSMGTGFFYGACYGSFPGIVNDAFGTARFSSNYGFIALSPVPVTYILTLRLGKLYDSYSTSGVCSGPHCYSHAFQLTSILSVCILLLVPFIILRLERSRSRVHQN